MGFLCGYCNQPSVRLGKPSLVLALTVIILGLTAPLIIDKLIKPASTQTIDYNSREVSQT
ncbi:MAG TPA: hypothetical protein EYH24_02710 [Thermococcus paralvinellae]|uniref:Uncharacterized protein n=1 Tax=Thermococcus paralvinellae TaxID=582419 RepID=A0A832ZEQ0_9EURY|nr:hypothetical protein [Thermococcus paralvinellae]